MGGPLRLHEEVSVAESKLTRAVGRHDRQGLPEESAKG